MIYHPGAGMAAHARQCEQHGQALIIGVGFIGRRMASGLADAGWSVRALTRTSTPALRAFARAKEIELIDGDASSLDAVRAAVRGCDLVVYCAGGLMPAESNDASRLDVALSLHPVLTVLEALRAHPGTRFSFLSSGGTVYGIPNVDPVPEDHALDPLTSYGILKVAAEKYIGMHCRLHGLEADILRCSNVYGPGQRGDRSQGVVAAFLDRLLRGEAARVFGDGGVIRDYVHVDDVVSVVHRLRAVPPPNGEARVLNVGSGVGTSLVAVLRELERATGTTALLERLQQRDFDIPAIVLDTSRLRAAIDFEATTFEDGISALVTEVQVSALPQQLQHLR